MLKFLFRQIYNNKRIIKYLISGGTAAFVDIVLLYIFTDFFGLWYLLSAIISFLIAYFVSFYLQKFWTFRDNTLHNIRRQMIIYFIVGVTNLGINTAGMYLLVDKFKRHYLIAQIIMGALISFSSYLIYRFFIFSKKDNSINKKYNKNSMEDDKENKRLKVLIATGIYPPDIGGPATIIKSLVKSLKENNIKIKIISYGDNINLENKKIKFYDKELYLVDRKKITRHIKYFLAMYKLAQWSQVIYVTDIYSVGYFAYLLHKIMGKKYIVRFAGDSAWETSAANGWINDYIIDFQNKKYNNKIEKLKTKRKKILINADKIIAVSKFMSKIALIIGVKKENIEVIYNSVDFNDLVDIKEKEVEEIRKKYGLGAKIIITSCRLTPWKGVDEIIKILPDLITKIGRLSFIIIGNGRELDKLKKLSEKLNIRDNVFFLGRLKHEETLKYIKAADLYILNSNYEGLSHALLDAMYMKTPILSTKVGGNTELIQSGKEGILVEYNNKEELLNSCFSILNNYNLAQEFTNNAKRKLINFNWNNTVDRTVKLLFEYA